MYMGVLKGNKNGGGGGEKFQSFFHYRKFSLKNISGVLKRKLLFGGGGGGGGGVGRFGSRWVENDTLLLTMTG